MIFNLIARGDQTLSFCCAHVSSVVNMVYFIETLGVDILISHRTCMRVMKENEWEKINIHIPARVTGKGIVDDIGRIFFQYNICCSSSAPNKKGYN